MFKRNKNQFQKRHDFMFNIIATIIMVGFVGIVVFWVWVGATLVQSAGAIQEQGLKSVIESVWCGKNNKNCI